MTYAVGRSMLWASQYFVLVVLGGLLSSVAFVSLSKGASSFKSTDVSLLLMSPQMQISDIPQNQDPLLLRTARGEKVERVPVWMMRQAGRHMKAYRDLCQNHKTFRERSENADIATEIR